MTMMGVVVVVIVLMVFSPSEKLSDPQVTLRNLKGRPDKMEHDATKAANKYNKHFAAVSTDAATSSGPSPPHRKPKAFSNSTNKKK